MRVVIVVDDDDAVRDSLGFLLGAYKFEAQLYKSGEDALSAPGLNDADCVLLDLDLPGINGLDVMAIMRNKMPYLPVVLMTALRTGQLNKAARRAGAAALVDKPVEEGKLIKVINAAINASGYTQSLHPPNRHGDSSHP